MCLKNYKLSFDFCPHCGDFVPGVSFLKKEFSDPWVSQGGGGGIVTGEGDTCINSLLDKIISFLKALIKTNFPQMFKYMIFSNVSHLQVFHMYLRCLKIKPDKKFYPISTQSI